MKNLLFILYAILLPFISHAQEKKAAKFTLWGFGGFSPMVGSYKGPMLGGGFGLNASRDNKFFLTFQHEMHYSLRNSGYGRKAPDRLHNTSLLLGRGKIGKSNAGIIASAGISLGKRNTHKLIGWTEQEYWWEKRHPIYAAAKIEYNIGFPVLVQVIGSGRTAGASLNFYAYVQRYSMYGVSLNLHFGCMRRK